MSEGEGEAALLPSGLPVMVNHITLSIPNVIRKVPTSSASDFTARGSALRARTAAHQQIKGVWPFGTG